jgi:RNA polymerase sigma-70 factor (ECF subfamily)
LAIENDNQILQAISTGKSEEAATAFVRKYQNFVYSTALRYLHSHEDADDVSQDVFIKALDSLKKFRGDSSLKTWLYRITVNMCANYKRKKKFVSFFKHEEIEDYFDLKSDDILPDASVENQEFQERFLKILETLPEKQRETFSLRYFDEMPYEEISQMLGTTTGGLKANYFQAVKKLAQLLKTEQ